MDKNEKKFFTKDQYIETKMSVVPRTNFVAVVKESDFDNVVMKESLSHVSTSNIIKQLRSFFDEDEILEDERKFSEIESKLSSALSIVGIMSEVKGESEFFPHGREFHALTNMGEFYFENQIVIDWIFPVIGAERLTHSKLKSSGILTPHGIVSVNSVSKVIDSAREKLDGFEVVTFGIRTLNGKYFFEWSDTEIIRVNRSEVSLCERVSGVDVLLNGTRNDIRKNEWEYLTTTLVEDVEEGLMVRIAGREYRVPRYLSATFVVRVETAYSCCGREMCPADKIEDGLHDFNFVLGKWRYWKERRDKVRADSYNGIEFMLNFAVNLTQLDLGLVIPLSDRQFIHKEVELQEVDLDNRAKSYQRKDGVHQVYKSTKRRNKQNRGKKREFTIEGDVCSSPNEIIISGQSSKFKRSKFVPFTISEFVYTPVPLGFDSVLSKLENKEFIDNFITSGGYSYLRCFKTRIKSLDD